MTILQKNWRIKKKDELFSILAPQGLGDPPVSLIHQTYLGTFQFFFLVFIASLFYLFIYF